MDFSWSNEQQELYKKIIAYSQAKFNSPLPSQSDKTQSFLQNWKLCGDFGLLGLCVPEQYGGIGLDAVSTAYAIEAFGKGCHDGGLVFSVSAHLFACVMPILENSSNEIILSLIPKLCSGEWVGANAITETEAGSDVFALKTKAIRDGDFYILSGTKTYVTNGPIADLFLVYASTNPSHGHLGVSAFIVKRDTPGLTLGKPFEKMGLDTSPIGPIYLDDCRVPVSYLVGQEGAGANIFKNSMQWERACLFAGYLGLMQRQLDQAIDYAKSRRQFRKPIGKNQAISHRIVDMKLRLESARWLLYHACWQMDQAKDDVVMEVSLAKLAISEAAILSSLDIIQIYGGNGFMVENGIEAGLRDSIASKIFSGTSEIQRDIIASKLGL